MLLVYQQGFRDLDKITTGLHPDQLVILAARPAVGKTAFALNIAQNVGTKQNRPVAIFSLEMGAESLVDRMLAAEGMVDSHNLRTGQLTDQEWNNITIAQELWLMHQSILTIRLVSRLLKFEHVPASCHKRLKVALV